MRSGEQEIAGTVTGQIWAVSFETYPSNETASLIRIPPHGLIENCEIWQKSFFECFPCFLFYGILLKKTVNIDKNLFQGSA